MRRGLPWSVLLVGGCLGFAGCGKSGLPEGVFSCGADDECPDSWYCHSDCRCYRQPDPAPAPDLDRCAVDGG